MQFINKVHIFLKVNILSGSTSSSIYSSKSFHASSQNNYHLFKQYKSEKLCLRNVKSTFKKFTFSSDMSESSGFVSAQVNYVEIFYRKSCASKQNVLQSTTMMNDCILSEISNATI